MHTQGSCSDFRFETLRLSALLVVCLVPCVLSLYPDILHVGADQIYYLLNSTNILGDVIQKAPNHTCMVSYYDEFAVELGNTIEPKELRYAPHWCRWTGDNDSYYTFIMTGPDEPSRDNPTDREYIHWLIGNVKGDRILLEKEYIYDYIGPDPEIATGKHRHVYLVYRQPNGKKLKFKEKRLEDEREDPLRYRFSTMKFAEKYNLGDPVAVNFLFTEWGPNRSRVIPPWSRGGVVTLPSHPDYVWDPEERMPWYLSKKDLQKPNTPEPF